MKNSFFNIVYLTDQLNRNTELLLAVQFKNLFKHLWIDSDTKC